jgi:hypothetical protein
MSNDNNSNSIKQLMQKVLQDNKLENGILELDIIQAWKKVMGNGVWTYTTSIKFNKGLLVVALRSSTLREELNYGKDKIISMLNECLKKSLIKKIRLN